MAVTTVAQFAQELNRPTTALLEQLQSAGVAKRSPDDALTEADKERLLDFLRTAHGTAAGAERKKITLTKKSITEIKQADETESVRKLFVEKLDVDEEVADILIAEGFTSLEEVAYVPLQEMLEIEAFDEDTVHELRNRAKDALLTMEIAQEERVDEVSQDLRDLEGLSPDLIARLAEGGVHTRDDLADLAVDELTEMTGIDEERAKALIMKAREHWFAEEERK